MKEICILTGSHAYGIPTESSDVDLVVLVDMSTKTKLIELSETGKEPIRFGKLNLIVTTCPDRFLCWKDATNKLINLGVKLTKQQTIEVFDNEFKNKGLSKSDRESGE
jgi:hypothetical protein